MLFNLHVLRGLRLHSETWNPHFFCLGDVQNQIRSNSRPFPNGFNTSKGTQVTLQTEKVSQLARCSFIPDAQKKHPTESFINVNQYLAFCRVKLPETWSLEHKPRKLRVIVTLALRTGSWSPAAKSLRSGNGREPFCLTSQISSRPQGSEKFQGEEHRDRIQ